MWTLGCTRANKAIFLIPNHYSGEVVVIFNQKNGSSKKDKNGRRLYEIPDNGILLTKNSREKGKFNYKFYYVYSEDSKKKIPSTLDIENEGSSEEVYISQLVTGQKVYPINDCQVRFLVFRVISSISSETKEKNLLEKVLPVKYPTDPIWQCLSP
jgi:hypothetical protein